MSSLDRIDWAVLILSSKVQFPIYANRNGV